MGSQEKNNYFKLVALIVDISYHVIWKYFSEKIVGENTFTFFLNRKEIKHSLVHAYETSKCCECFVEQVNRERLISKKQLLLLYTSDETKLIRGHQQSQSQKQNQICICNYFAIDSIDVNVIDITLANCIIKIFGIQEKGLDNWMKQIKDVRNEIFHLSDTRNITDEKFNRKWAKLEGSILGIAKLIDSTYAEETLKRIRETKTLIIIPDCMLKYEILCREYWRQKCTEFEVRIDISRYCRF